jgi:hypothetical protein
MTGDNLDRNKTGGHDKQSEWINYSDLNKVFYNSLLGLFTLGASLVTHPLTVISVRQQAGHMITGDGNSLLGGNLVSQMRNAFTSIGYKGFFRGWGVMAAVGAPSNVIYFDLMEKSRETFQHNFRNLFPTAPDFVIDGLQATCSSVIATFVSLIPFVPGEVLSSRLIVQGREGMGTVDMAKMMYREKGISVFFRGFNSSFLVGMVGGAQWWFSYGLCRKYGMDRQWGKDHSLLVECSAGLIAGVSSTMIAHPMDTVKTRIMTSCMQSSPHSFSSLFLHVARTERPIALFRGMPAALYQAAIGSTLFAGMYEIIKEISQKQ